MSKRFCNKLEKKLFSTRPRGFLPMFCTDKKCENARERQFRSSRASFVRQLNNSGANAKLPRAVSRVRSRIIAFCETIR
ncbi:hypothetical protein [Burkholderia pyrrocinia]|uniref:hypothetical protein n=1 Tax=Burkholderia pyrrocinia TaxID=60550 RepID=UPI002AB29609|nr:hypothetical protein [Burkholderia pyrrocinia]